VRLKGDDIRIPNDDVFDEDGCKLLLRIYISQRGVEIPSCVAPTANMVYGHPCNFKLVFIRWDVLTLAKGLSLYALPHPTYPLGAGAELKGSAVI